MTQPTKPLAPEELHVYEPDGVRDKYVQRCAVCHRGRRALVHR